MFPTLCTGTDATLNSPGSYHTLLYSASNWCLKITGALTGLRIIGYNRSKVDLVWEHPDYPTSSFTYLITSKPLQSETITKYPQKAFLKEDDPFISIDLEGTECELVEIRVAVFGEEEEAQSVNVTLPSCELVCVFSWYAIHRFFHVCVCMCESSSVLCVGQHIKSFNVHSLPIFYSQTLAHIHTTHPR